MRQALTHTGVITTAARSKTPYAPAWQALFTLLNDKHARIAMCRFARFCTDRGIPPADVTDKLLDTFLLVLTEDSLIKRPRVTHQTTIRVWNRMAGHVSGLAGPEAAGAELQQDLHAALERLPADARGGGNPLSRPPCRPEHS